MDGLRDLCIMMEDIDVYKKGSYATISEYGGL